MAIQTVTVDRIEAFSGKSQRGRSYTRWTLHTVDGQRISIGFNKPSSDVQSGAVVEVDVETTPEGYINGKIVAVKSAGTGGESGEAASPVARAPTAAKRYRANGEAGGFPVHPLAYERTLDRRNAINAAVALVAAQASLASTLTSAQQKELIKVMGDPEAIVTLATRFEQYTCGDLERAEMKLRADRRKKEAAEEAAKAKAEAAAAEAAAASSADDMDDDPIF